MDFGGRYLGVFSPPENSSSIVKDDEEVNVGDELNEDDVFWTGDFAANSGTRRKKKSSDGTASYSDWMFAKRSPFQKEERFGILAALGDGTVNGQSFRRKSSMSPASASKNVVAIPKVKSVEKEVASPKFNYSAPVNVPIMSKEMMKANARRSNFFDVVYDDSGDDEMLPPHEIVARGSGVTPNTTFSMLEGAGRTLKGRDLRRVRNAVFRQTGFLD